MVRSERRLELRRYKPKKARWVGLLIRGSVLLLALVGARGTALAGDFEVPPVLEASEAAPAKLLKGEHFQVQDSVPTDGLTTHFTILSDAGVFEANGVETLALRVSEVGPILELQSQRQSSAFANAAAAAAARPVQATAQIVADPAGTARGLPSGVGRLFGRVGSGARNVAGTVADSRRSREERATAAAGKTGRITANALGYDQELRQLAQRLGVDPYTTNVRLAQEMHDYAWVAFSGRVGVNTLVSVFVPVSLAVSSTRMTRDLVYDVSSADLIIRNAEKLQSMGVSDEAIQALQQAPGFTLSIETGLVEGLGRLEGTSGREHVVELAGTVETYDQALLVTRAVLMLAGRHERGERVAALLPGRPVVARLEDGTQVVPAPVDYLSWVEDVAGLAAREDLQVKSREVLLTGRASPRAKRELETRGWTVRERVGD